MLRRHKVSSIARKEIRDILRDRRTLFMAIVFPLILYPLLIIGIIQAALVQEGRKGRATVTIAVSGADFAPNIAANFDKEEGVEVVPFEDKEMLFGNEKAVAAVIFTEEFREALARGGTARVPLFYESADPQSVEAMQRAVKVLEGTSSFIVKQRLERRDLPDGFNEPIAIDRKDLATARQRGASHISQILAFLLVVLCLTGALYPALDAVAGEKERGTLETLLSIPASRLEVLAGKYLAVFGMSVASVASNFVSLAGTMFLVNLLLKSQSIAGEPTDYSVPLTSIFLFVPALLPLAAFFSAITLGVASFARSTREGQYYLGPLYAVVLPLTALALAPGIRLTWFTSVAPVLSTALFLKEGILRTLEIGPALVSLATTILYAALALKWAAAVFSREEVLFSMPTGENERARARGVAAPAHALFIWAVSVILFFFLGLVLQQKIGYFNPFVTLAVYLAFVIGPPAAYVMLWRLDWRKVFPWGRAEGWTFASVVFFAPGVVMLGLAAKAAQSFFLIAPSAHGMAGLPADVEQVSVYAFAISIALIPAIFEELMYRGFVMQSLLARMKPAAAIVIAAILFGIAHMSVFQIMPTAVLGVVLGIAAYRTGGVMAPIMVHFLNNLFAVLVYKGVINFAVLNQNVEGAKAVALIAVFTVIGAGLVWLGWFVAGDRRGRN
jgi:sodium transport system permease protein